MLLVGVGVVDVVVDVVPLPPFLPNPPPPHPLLVVGVRVAVISTVITIEKQKLKARSHPPPTLRDAKYNPSYTSTYSF